MTAQDRAAVVERIAQYDRLEIAGRELTSFIDALRHGLEFTGNASQVKRFTRVSFLVEGVGEASFSLSGNAIHGFEIRDLFLPFLEQRRDALWKMKEKL